jgi:hypothetical protein
MWKSIVGGGGDSFSKRIHEPLLLLTLFVTMTTSPTTLLAVLADIKRRQLRIDSEWQLLHQELESDADFPEEEEHRPSTPVPSSPVRLTPPGAPRKQFSTTLQTGLSRSGKLMTKLPNGRWVPAPSMPIPSLPPWHLEDIEIPQGEAPPTEAPPPPRHMPARICNCDSDGECDYCQEERVVDTRQGCETCAGCVNCQRGAGYDGD